MIYSNTCFLNLQFCFLSFFFFQFCFLSLFQQCFLTKECILVCFLCAFFVLDFSHFLCDKKTKFLIKGTTLGETTKEVFNKILLDLIYVKGCTAAAAIQSLQSCPTLCDPIDGSPPGFPVPGILQARTLELGCHFLLQCMKVKSESEVTQSCLTLSDPMDCSLPASSAHGIFQVRVLEWVAIAFSAWYVAVLLD